MRCIGYEQAYVSYGIEPVVLEPDSWDSRDGYDVMRATDRLPQDVQTADDQLALSTMCYIYERRRVVSRDVRVVGSDDIDGADSHTPSLTTIHQPFGRLGRTAVRLVRSFMGGDPSQDIALDPELVIRANSYL